MVTTNVCRRLATRQYDWPGQETKYICDEHVGKLRQVAKALGVALNEQEADIREELHYCTQQVSGVRK